MSDLNHYIEAFANLKRGGGGKYATRPATLYKAPHKPLLLLSVLDLAAEGMLPRNSIELSPGLEARFEAYWSLVMKPADQTTIAIPYFHMANEGFWRLQPRSGQKHWAAMQRYTPSSAQLKRALVGARLDGRLYALIRNPAARAALRRALIEAHFDPAVHELLLQHGSQSDAGSGELLPTGMDMPARTPRTLAALYGAVRRILEAVGLVDERPDQLYQRTSAGEVPEPVPETVTISVATPSQTEADTQRQDGHPDLQGYVARATSTDVVPPAAPDEQTAASEIDTTDSAPETPAGKAPAHRDTSAELELFRRWLAGLLARREREIIARRFGLFGEPEQAVALARRYDEPEAKMRQIERTALRVLQDHWQGLAPIYSILEQALDEHGRVLQAARILQMPEFASASEIGLRPAGLLALLAAIREDWRFYAMNGGIVVAFRERDEPPPAAAPEEVTGAGLREEPYLEEAEAESEGPDTAEPVAGPMFKETEPVYFTTENSVEASAEMGEAPILEASRPAHEVVEEKTAAPAPAAQRRKLRETGPLWLAPVSRAVEPTLDPRSPLFSIEMELRERLRRVDFVGELAIERSQFEEWCRLVRKEVIRAGTVRAQMVPPALFVTLMVLTARYSEEEDRSFWQPYAHLVWNLDEASQSFQNQGRAYFRRAIDYLARDYGLVFPQRSVGDLVRPVYRHAIIPAYLEREFVTWLRSRWKDVLEVPAEHLVAHLQQEQSLRYLSPTLSRFISEPDTSVAAADLIRNMAFAASLYAEGQSLDFIGQLLADNPIERTLWEEFVAGQTEQETRQQRRPQAHLEWVWSLETAELVLRLRNAILKTTSKPDLAVWVDSGTRPQELARAQIYSRLDPWQLEAGTWLVDELIFAEDGPLTGKVILLGDDDSILWEQTIPPLPQGPVQFFRLTQQRVYALPIDTNSLQPGDYVLACDQAVTLNGVEAAVALADEPLTLPYRLTRRFSFAGVYQVSMPLTVRHESQTLVEVATSATGLAAAPPTIYGQRPVPGLSPRVPPAFADRDIWLLLPGASNRLLDRTTLWLRSQPGVFQKRLLRELDMEVDEAGTLWAPLHDLLDENGGFYTLELRQGLRALLPAPLELVHVPRLECVPPPEAPPDQPVYTPAIPPSTHIRGIELDQIGNLAQVEAAPGEDDWLVITWHELRGDCRLLLRVNEQSIPLAWPVKRFSAWTEPEADDVGFTPEQLEEVVVHAAGSSDVVGYFFLSIAGQEGRQRIDLNAQGQFSVPLRQHPLFDMIRHANGPRVQVDVSVFSQSWPLLVVRREEEHTTVRAAGVYLPAAPQDYIAAAIQTEEDKQRAREEVAQVLAGIGDREPNARELWSLASAPLSGLKSTDLLRLTTAWAPLGEMLRVHEAKRWEEDYGLLPIWAVASRPLYFVLNRGTTVVYPEAALQQGRRGIGYTNLRFAKSLTRVYVSWEPSEQAETVVAVRFGMPPQIGTRSYLDVDELDLEAVFQCKVCGVFLSYRQWPRHTHAGQRYPDTVDLLNSKEDTAVLVRISPAAPGTKLPFQHVPADVVDSTVVTAGLHSGYGYDTTQRQSPSRVTAAGHRHASMAWLQRYWEMPGGRSHIPQLFSHPQWQATATALEKLLSAGAGIVPPAGAAMARLLGACRPRDYSSVYGLDHNVLLLAFLARHAAHDAASAASLRQRVAIDQTLIGQLLYDADIYIPELLEWALTWSEVFFIHTLN